MSTPLRLQLPESVSAVGVPTSRGETPALEAVPRHPDPGASPAVLVPGFTGSKEDFLEILQPLASAGFRVVAIDLRGQFGSYSTRDAAAYDLDALADDVLAVGSAVGGPTGFHLVGHSFGGLVARSAALRGTAGLRSLTLMSTGPAALPEPGHQVHLLRELLAILPTEDLEAIYARKRELETAGGGALHPPEIEDFLRERFLAHCPTALRRMAEQLLTEPDRTEKLAEVVEAGLPTHVLYGGRDDAWPPSEQADMARRLRAEETVIPEAMHSPAVEEPAETAFLLAEFWRSQADHGTAVQAERGPLRGR